MRFKEKAGQTYTHPSTRQVHNLLTTATRGGTGWVTILKGMSDIENDWEIIAASLHDTEPEHVNYQIVISHAAATVTQDQLVVTRFLKLLDDVAHLRRAQELRFFDIYWFPCLCHRNYKICLASKERRQLQHIHNFSYRRCLVNFMNVGNDRHTKFRFYFLKYSKAFLHSRAAIRVDRRTVCFIKASFENVWDSELFSDAYVFCASG